MSLFSERLIARRNSLNLTQKELAQKSGLSESAITALEREVNPPTARSLEKLSAALSVSASWLMGGVHSAAQGTFVSYSDEDREHVWSMLSEPLLRAAMAELSQLTDDDRTLVHLEAIIAELRRRAPKQDVVSSKRVYEAAVASMDDAAAAARRLPGSQPKHKAGSPIAGKSGQAGDAGKGT